MTQTTPLTTRQPIGRYHDQTGRPALTPRQSQRVHKKQRRADKLRELAEAAKEGR
jgi:hypothetical protein